MRFTADTFKQRISEGLPALSPQLADGRGVFTAVGSEEPAVIDLSSLLGMPDDEQFVREGYRRVLGRECDPVGFVNFREMLRNGAPRQTVLNQLINSDEARQLGRRFAGVPDSKLLPRNLTYKGRGLLRSARRAVMGRIRGVFHTVLQATRIEHLEHKLDYLLQEVATRSDQMSAKADQNLWTLAEKVDAYTLTVLKKQNVGGATMETAHPGGEGSVLHSAAGILHTESLQLLREELATAMELQHRSNQRLLEMLSSGKEEMAGALNDVVTRQVAIEAQQLGLWKEIESRSKAGVFRGGDNVLVSEVNGFIVGVPGEEWRMAAYHAFRGPMEPGLLRAFEGTVKPGMVVLDIGANIGMFTLHAARRLAGDGKIYSFEPAPRVFAILKDNVQVNGFLESGVIGFRQMAAWDESGTARMTVYGDDSGRSTLFPGERHGHEIEVLTRALDDELGSQTRVDVAKIDAEGAEPRILRGMRGIIERNPDIAIFIEFAPVHLRRAGVEPAAFLDEIAAMGFVVRRVDDVSGELHLTDRDQLVASFSANLMLSRPPA